MEVLIAFLARLRAALASLWPGRRKANQAAPGPAGARPPLYLFFDEAGDLDFKSGTRHFVCGILATYDPWPVMKVLTELRERIFRGGFIPQAFHAAEDKQAVRDQVFAAICEWGDFRMHLVVLEKGGVPASHREQAKFYAFAADLALRRVLERHRSDEPVFIITDTLPLKGKREALVKGFKASLSAILPDREYRIEHHPSGTQGGLQAADYVNWAVFKKWERGELRPYELIRGFVVQEGGFDWSLIRNG